MMEAGASKDCNVPGFPIISVDVLREYLRAHGSPDILVGFEFSGAMRGALTAAGANAISTDERDSQQPGPHFRGEIREATPLKHWDAIYFVGPNCYQMLRADKDCLSLKIKDGRAFWGVATVLWCICQANAKMVLVEQPDTIAVDYLPDMASCGVEVMELRTSQYGDKEDKFMRLTTRNMQLPALTHEAAAKKDKSKRTQFVYANPEERDKSRSTWANFPRMCEALARATPRTDPPPPCPAYLEEIEKMAEAWHRAGHPVPHDYNNADARPTSKEDREYAKTRGPGDGRSLRQVVPRRCRAEETEANENIGRRAERTEGTSGLEREKPDSAPNIVVPVRVEGDHIFALLPEDEDEVFYVNNHRVGKATTSLAERATSTTVGGDTEPIGYRAANTAEGKQVVVTVCQGKGEHEEAVTVGHRRRRPITTLKGALWCTLAALTMGRPQTMWAQLAICSTAQFMTHGVNTLRGLATEAALQEQMGANPGKGPLMAPRQRLYEEGHRITPRDLIQESTRGINELKDKIQSMTGREGDALTEWADTIQPLNIKEVPEALLDKPLGLEDMQTTDHLFSERLPIYELPWLERMPKQEPLAPACAGFLPRDAGDLLAPRAKAEVERWMRQAQVDLKCLEMRGADCDRADRPKMLAFGEESLHECARDRVWDCRGDNGCVLLDHHAPIKTALNLEKLRQRFDGYPDQRLASNVLEGVRLEADVERQVVLHPNLASVGEGYDSVQKTVRELAAKGFYEMYGQLPFIPIVVTGQGARIKKLGVKKYRRTSNFSAPHRETYDKQGRRVVAINDASRCYYAPEWLQRARAELRAWDERRYSHVRWTDADKREAPTRFKFPKELKPKIIDVMIDGTVLLKGAKELKQTLFVWVWDASYYFNQFAYAPEELWKSTLIVGARPGDMTEQGRPFSAHEPVMVAENRLGFGSYASSNIAQRFSNALVNWTLQEFDRLEEEARLNNPDLAWERWIAARRPLEQRCKMERPKRKGQAETDCTQTRLASMHMYTDDPIVLVVGVDRAIRFLQAWNKVTSELGVHMAGTEKRQMGGQVEWIGITILAAIGLVVVPRNKLLRARDGVLRALLGHMIFGEYRALMGLLEHLRFIAMLEADSTNALYRPHGATGASAGGPNATVRPDALMTTKLEEWAAIIMSCAGATFTMAFAKDTSQLWRSAHDAYTASSDAAGDGKGTPGLGGYMHGFWWRIPLDEETLKAMHITAWEALAAAVNALVADRLAGPEGVLMLKTDAALVPYAIAHKKSKSQHVQVILHELLANPRYRDQIAKRITVQHVSGEANVMSDLVSRGLWEAFEELCSMLDVKPVETPLNADERNLVTNVLRQVDERAAQLMLAHFERELTKAEKGLAKERSDCTDGDGPFTPPWAKAQQRAQRTAERRPSDHEPPPRPTTTAHESTTTRFTPPWARAERRTLHEHEVTQARPETTTTERAARRETTHPYAKPTGMRTLGEAHQASAHRLVQRLVNDRTPGRIKATEQELVEMATEIAQVRADGSNPRTGKKDDLAWKEWSKYAEMKGFDPHLRTAWTRAFPERECLKLTGFVLYTAQTMKPRANSDKVAKPLSVNQRYLALRRVFKSQDVELPPDAAVHSVIKGLIKRYIRAFGIADLRPSRVEPITPTIVDKLVKQAEQGNTKVNGKPWRIQDRDCFNITAWQVINLQVGSRKGEATKLQGDIDYNDWFTRSSVTYRRAGRVITNPTATDLQEMTEGDHVMLSPKGAKCDQWGTCHGTEPIILPYHDKHLNPAKWMVRLELTYPCASEQRATTPLFAQQDNQPYTDTRFSRLVKSSLQNVLGPTRARLYSPHSWRVWLASALRMSGASDARIQAFGRWLNPDSIKIYARITTQEYAHWMDKVMTVRSLDTARTTNLPIMDAADALVQYHEGTDEDATEHQEPTTRPAQPRPSQRHPAHSRCQERPTAVCAPHRGQAHRHRRPRPTGLGTASLTPTVPPHHLLSTTTGVGSLSHRFPNSLDNYTTYEDRPSKRRPPVTRTRP